jgi:hypothetical protein
MQEWISVIEPSIIMSTVELQEGYTFENSQKCGRLANELLFRNSERPSTARSRRSQLYSEAVSDYWPCK